MADEDAELVALIDSEHDEGSRGALLVRLATDERLRRRYDELRTAGAPIAGSLEELLRQAPLEWLRAAILVWTRSPAAGRFASNGLRHLAAGIAIGLLAAGAAACGAAGFGLLKQAEDWRSAVVQYTNLYTNQTFSPLNPDASLQVIELCEGAWGQGGGHQPDPRKTWPSRACDLRLPSCSPSGVRRWA
jgi:anti-sigma factor RsiW